MKYARLEQLEVLFSSSQTLCWAVVVWVHNQGVPSPCCQGYYYSDNGVLGGATCESCPANTYQPTTGTGLTPDKNPSLASCFSCPATRPYSQKGNPKNFWCHDDCPTGPWAPFCSAAGETCKKEGEAVIIIAPQLLSRLAIPPTV